MRTPPRLAALVLALAVLGCGARAQASPQIEVRVADDHGALVIAASAWLAADTSTAWSVLTDYGRYREFIPGVRASRVVARYGTRVVVEQSDDLALWPIRVPVRVTYQIDESPPAGLTSRAYVASLPPLEGTFALHGCAMGVRLDYVGRIGAGGPILGRFEQPALEHAALAGFQALADEIERTSSAARD